MEELTANDESLIRLGGVQNAPVTEDQVVFTKEFFTEGPEVIEKLNTLVTLDAAEARLIAEEVMAIWAAYQEQPGLMDPRMGDMVLPLINVISSFVHDFRLPIPANVHLCCSLLYCLNGTRGYKIVVRRYPHEARDLEPCLEAIEAAMKTTTPWSTRYTLILWLATVLLTPFDLTSIGKNLIERISNVGFVALCETSRTREAAAFMLGRLFTRPDASEGWTRFVDFLAQQLKDSNVHVGVSSFAMLGALQALHQTLKMSPKRDQAFQLSRLWTHLNSIEPQALARQSLLRKLRTTCCSRIALTWLPPRPCAWRYQRGARSLLSNMMKGQEEPAEEEEEACSGEVNADDEIPDEIEELVELLLESLSDNDTIVRWAAAKCLGRVTARLPKDFADQVVESFLDRGFSALSSDKSWHGACLGIAELARRGLLLPERLSVVIPHVCSALLFDVVTGTQNLGQHVRDAACYASWAFARAYGPSDLLPYVEGMATSLLCVALFDREVNCRRAAAAACQEHVGRQGTFPNGIDVVTVTDYWTVSNRTNAYRVAAPKVADLRLEYRQCFINHLVDKLGHVDPQIREVSAQALGDLATSDVENYLNTTIIPKLASIIDDQNSTVSMRHGAMLTLTSMINAKFEWSEDAKKLARNVVPKGEKQRMYRGRGGEQIRIVACNLLCSVCASSWAFPLATVSRYLTTLEECLQHSGDLSVQWAAMLALESVRLRMSDEMKQSFVEACCKWLEGPDPNIAQRRGAVLALGLLPADVDILCRELEPGAAGDLDDPTTRQNAALSLGRRLETLDEAPPVVISALMHGCQDYARDRRGDVGSWVRVAACESLAVALNRNIAQNPTEVLCALLQQAMDKIDNVRCLVFELIGSICNGTMDFRKAMWRQSPSPSAATERRNPMEPSTPTLHFPHGELLRSIFEGKPDDCGLGIYSKASPLFDFPEYRRSVLTGFIPSSGGVTESTCRASSTVLLKCLRQTNGRALCEDALGLFSIERLTLPLVSTVALVIQQGLWPLELSLALYDATFSAIRKSCKDVALLQKSADVFVGLLDGDASRRKALGVLLTLLGHKYPKVRIHTAKALYIKLLEFDEFKVDLENPECEAVIVKDAAFEEMLELLATGCWADCESVGGIRVHMHALLGIPPPKFNPTAKKAQAKAPSGYADLVSEAHY
eukprot:GEMP01004801.1.p1 GENE.GEMP01004801.1~~GEMP01004801.1.p1  ORF type:complete len:1173 (+),score=284.24 GEMP01004801.1:133-3651(+)